MHIEFECACCGCDFVHEPEFCVLEDGEQMDERLLHGALGDGGTIEDSLNAALGDIPCPECGATARVGEEDLGRLAMAMLTAW